jgi:hypothetical protein
MNSPLMQYAENRNCVALGSILRRHFTSYAFSLNENKHFIKTLSNLLQGDKDGLLSKKHKDSTIISARGSKRFCHAMK